MRRHITPHAVAVLILRLVLVGAGVFIMARLGTPS
jgi:hypothetical protein